MTRHNKKEPIITGRNMQKHPTRTLDPPITIVEQAKEIEKAEELLKFKVHHKLDLILRQIKVLQEEARNVVQAAHDDMEMHKVRCAFQKVPGEILYLYDDKKHGLYFSRLSPADWNNHSPHAYKGAYRMSPDRSYECVDEECL
jgi:hypothetical protein